MASSATARTRARTSDFVNLAERMGYMQALRGGFAVVVLASGLFAEGVIGASFADLLLLTAGYLVLSATIEGLRQIGRARGIWIVGGMLLVDAVYLAWVMYSTGGTQSPLRFLVYLHIVAVTLLASYKTGLKITLWHSLLFFVVFYAQVSGILEPVEATGIVGGAVETSPSIFNVTAFWLVAIGTAAFSALNERELRRQRNHLEALTEMSLEMEQVSKPSEIAQSLIDKVNEAFDFKRSLVLGSPGGVDLELLAYRAPGEPAEFKSGADNVIRAAWDDREEKRLKQLDPEKDAQLAALLPFARNVIVVPLIAGAEPQGVLVVEHGGGVGSRIERRIVRTLKQFAGHGAMTLRNAWLYERVQLMAETDALTGLANRRTFESTLERELSRAERSGEQLTLVMLDLDHFKSLNDTYGHQAGDEVLKMAASALIEACRDFDTPARYGGEEFVAVLPACTTSESLVVAERLRQCMNNIDFEHPVTASAGVATFPAHASDAQSLIKAADEALYESKRAGRDRVTRSRRRGRSRAKTKARTST